MVLYLLLRALPSGSLEVSSHYSAVKEQSALCIADDCGHLHYIDPHTHLPPIRGTKNTFLKTMGIVFHSPGKPGSLIITQHFSKCFLGFPYKTRAKVLGYIRAKLEFTFMPFLISC